MPKEFDKTQYLFFNRMKITSVKIFKKISIKPQ